MKAAFIHDHNFVYHDGDKQYYDGSGGVFDVYLWNRYLEVFSTLIVVGRKIRILPNKLVLSSADGVSFELIEGASGFINIWKNEKRIRREIESTIKKVDFVIIRLPSTLGRFAQQICEKLNKKYVLEVVGDPFEAYWHHGNFLGKIIAPLEKRRLKKILNNAQHVIYVTQEKLQEKYYCPNNTIGISNVRLEEVVNSTVVSKFYQNTSKIFKIGLIGSFHVRYKGHFEAINAIKHLKNLGISSIKLYLVGTGDPKWIQNLVDENKLNDQVEIIGAIKAGENGIFPFLDSLDLYIHPSKTEGLPRVIIEAMSRGRLCLGSNVGGTKELLSNKYIHEPGDWKTLANQIESFIKLESNKRSLIAMNNLSIAENYLESVLQKKRVTFIQSIVNDETN